MAITFIVAASVGGNNTTVTTSAVDTSGANLLVMIVTGFNPPNNTPTDSKSNTWTATTAVSGTRFYYAWNPTSVGSGHTFTWNENVFAGISVLAFGGVQTSSDPLDTRTGNAAATSPGSISPAVSGELFVATIGGDGSSWDAETESTVFTLPTNGRVAYVGSTTEAAQGWYQINTDSTARNPVFSGPSSWCNMIAFKPSAGGGGGRGLFRAPSQSGVGIGGSFFRDPLQAREQMVKRHHIYVPERYAA